MTKTKTVKKTRARKKIEFQSIRSSQSGFIELSIYPPGTFIDNKHYSVFIGGCGYGEKKTLKEAKEFLLQCARDYCLREIMSARRNETHYRFQLRHLSKVGLEPRT